MVQQRVLLERLSVPSQAEMLSRKGKSNVRETGKDDTIYAGRFPLTLRMLYF